MCPLQKELHLPENVLQSIDDDENSHKPLHTHQLPPKTNIDQ